MAEWGAVGRLGGARWGAIHAPGLDLGSIGIQTGLAARGRSARPGHEKRGSRGGYPVSCAIRYSSKRRRNRSSMRLVNEPPPLLRRWRADPGADPERSGLPASRGPVIA